MFPVMQSISSITKIRLKIKQAKDIYSKKESLSITRHEKCDNLRLRTTNGQKRSKVDNH